jgi:hypothetical protein
MHMLIDAYKQFKQMSWKERHRRPQKIEDATKEWLARDSSLNEFLWENAIQERSPVEPEFQVHLSELYVRFVAHFRKNSPSERVPSKNIFKEDVNHIVEQPCRGGSVWRYLRWKTEEERKGKVEAII